VLRRLTPLLVVLVVATMAAGCGDDDSFDTGPLEDQIQAGIVDAFGVEVGAVVCPEDVQKQDGGTFTCIADVDRQDFRVRVTQGEGDTAPSFTNIDALITPQDAVEGAEQLAGDQLGFSVTANCGRRVIIGRPDETFDCTLTEESGATVSAQFRITDVDGSFELAQ
jgi:hypothetical protein